MSDTMSGAELLAKIKPQLRTIETGVCLRPDLLEAWEKKNNELIEAQANDSTSTKVGTAGARGAGAVSAATKKLAQEVRDLEVQIEDVQMWFVLEALPKDRWQTLCEEHPPRKDDQFDQYAGYDRVAVSDAAVRLCLISPVFLDCTKSGCTHGDCGSWQQFLSVCNPGEWVNLRDTADEVNGAVKTVPKSLVASRILDKAASTSKRPAAGG